jgi:hypothetical protein
MRSCWAYQSVDYLFFFPKTRKIFNLSENIR